MSLSKVFFLGICTAGLAACGAADSTPKNAVTTSDAPSSAISLTTAPGDAPAGTYTNDKTHAYITFHYVHQGYSRPFLRWRDWNSTLNWNPENPEASSVNVTINTNSIDTGVDIFDEHMRSADWLDVATYPTASFNSTSLTKTSERTGTMTGDLTLMGVTKPVTLDVTFNKAADGRAPGSHKIGFSANTVLMRSDWGLGKYAPAVSDKVDVIIEAEYVKAAAE